MQFLSEWKSKTRKKARQLKQNANKTGGGEYEGSLTLLEQRLLSVLGWVSVLGCPELPPEIDPDDELTVQNSSQVSQLELNNDDQEEILLTYDVEEVHNYSLPLNTKEDENIVYFQGQVQSKEQSGTCSLKAGNYIVHLY